MLCAAKPQARHRLAGLNWVSITCCPPTTQSVLFSSRGQSWQADTPKASRPSGCAELCSSVARASAGHCRLMCDELRLGTPELWQTSWPAGGCVPRAPALVQEPKARSRSDVSDSAAGPGSSARAKAADKRWNPRARTSMMPARAATHSALAQLERRQGIPIVYCRAMLQHGMAYLRKLRHCGTAEQQWSARSTSIVPIPFNSVAADHQWPNASAMPGHTVESSNHREAQLVLANTLFLR